MCDLHHDKCKSKWSEAGALIILLSALFGTFNSTEANTIDVPNEIYFAKGSSELNDVAHVRIEKQAAFLRNFDCYKAIVEGHTDRTGTDLFNKKLSLIRARVVRYELIRLGVSADRIGVIGYGSERPYCQTDMSETCQSQNRRTMGIVTNGAECN